MKYRIEFVCHKGITCYAAKRNVAKVTPLKDEASSWRTGEAAQRWLVKEGFSSSKTGSFIPQFGLIVAAIMEV